MQDSRSRLHKAKRLGRALLFSSFSKQQQESPSDAPPPSSPQSPPPLSTSADSCSSVTALCFLPFSSCSTSTPRVLVHVTDDCMLEVNPLPPSSPPIPPLLRYSLPPGMGDCVAMHSYDRCSSGVTFSCKLGLAYSSGVLLVLRLASVVGADWNCSPLGLVMPPVRDATKKYQFTFSNGGGPILAASQTENGASTNLYDVSSFSAPTPQAQASETSNAMHSLCCIPLENELKMMGDEHCLLPEALGICLLSSPSCSSQTLVTTHKGLTTDKIVLWDAISLSPIEFIDTSATLTGILQAGGGEPNNNTRFSLSGNCDDGTIGILDCSTPTRSVVPMVGKIKNGKRWCLACGGDFLAAVVGGEGDFEEELQMTTLHRSVPEVKKEHESKRRKVDPPIAPSLFSELPKCHEFEITSMCFAGSDSMIATGDSFGNVYVHGNI